ncbi:MAG: pyruvate carboxyltransferase [Firmicutes bacterium]|nr:pyruvate carboxyltransferase [Bacillota bacterium]
MNTPWKTDRWFVSPWNYSAEARRMLSFPEKIKFHDVTLRDGEQQAAVVFRKDEKIRIAEKLAELGIHRIEAGMPAVSRHDAEAITEIVKRNLGPEVFAFSRCMKEDVKRAVDTGVRGVVVEIPSSEHIIEHAYRWPLRKAIDLSIEATKFAEENGLYTVFFPIDASRAEMSWFLDLVTTVAAEGHMDALVVVDTFGGLAPHAIPYLIKNVKARVDKPIEIHFHDDFGLGAANTLMALAAGGEVAHTSVSALGERAGNAPYEDVALALLTMYGIDTGLKYEKMPEVSRLVQELAGVNVRPNRGIVGDMTLKIESGIIASWYANVIDEHPLELLPFRWDLVGQDAPEVVLGKNSGLDSIGIWLKKMGLSAGDREVEEILLRVKEKSFEKKGLLNEDEFRAIVRDVVR